MVFSRSLAITGYKVSETHPVEAQHLRLQLPRYSPRIWQDNMAGRHNLPFMPRFSFTGEQRRKIKPCTRGNTDFNPSKDIYAQLYIPYITHKVRCETSGGMKIRKLNRVWTINLCNLTGSTIKHLFQKNFGQSWKDFKNQTTCGLRGRSENQGLRRGLWGAWASMHAIAFDLFQLLHSPVRMCRTDLFVTYLIWRCNRLNWLDITHIVISIQWGWGFLIVGFDELHHFSFSHKDLSLLSCCSNDTIIVFLIHTDKNNINAFRLHLGNTALQV